jgi:hypothetical protein
MSTLYRLTEPGLDRVEENDAFFKGEETFDRTDFDDLIEPVEGEADFERLDEAVKTTQDAFDPDENRTDGSSMDANLAPIVHECIDIPRRVAADSGVWHYLTIVRYPDYVRYRFNVEKDIGEKFIGSGTNLYQNTFERLWWGAELTEKEDTLGYLPVQKMFAKQRIANYILDSDFRRYQPAARVFAEEMYRERGKDITKTATRLKKALSTYQLESRKEPELRRQVRRIREKVTDEI